MLKNNIISKKPLAIGVIVAFFGAIVLPSMSGDITSKNDIDVLENIRVSVSFNPNQFDMGGSRAVEGNEGEYLSFDVTFYWDPPDPERLICVWADPDTLPPGASFPVPPDCTCDYGEVTETFEWTPTYCQAGDYSVFFYGGETCGEPVGYPLIVNITIYNINRDPSITIAPEGPIDALVGDAIHVDVYSSDLDMDECGDDSLSLEYTIIPEPLTYPTLVDFGNGYGAFDWTPIYGDEGGYTVTFSVDDLYGGHNSIDCDITVRGLEPFFVTPDDGSMVYGEVFLQIGDLTGTTPDYVNFYYREEGTIEWLVIGTDYDGSDVTAPGEIIPPLEFGDGWSMPWDVDDLSEDWYDVKAEIIIADVIVGQIQTRLYVEPTPPIPEMYPVLDGDIVSMDIELYSFTLDTNVARVVYQAAPIPTYWKRTGVPNMSQFDYCWNISGKNLSNSACGPTAAAACLKYWNSTGFPNITKNGTANHISDKELVDELARLMNLTSKGTNASQIKKGIMDYLNRTGYGCTNTNGLKVNISHHTNAKPLNYSRWRNELSANKEDVIWLYHSPQATHWITATSFNNTEQTDEGGNKYHEIDFMCPTMGNVTARMYDNGTINRSDVNGNLRFPSSIVTVSEKNPGKNGWIDIGESTNPDDNWMVTWDTTTVPNGYYLVRATMEDDTGWQGDQVIVLKVENEITEAFTRGDADGDENAEVSMGDAIFILKHLYVPGSPDPQCFDSADSDDDGTIAMGDAIYLLKWLYVPGSPEPPYPGPVDCGADLTIDDLDCQYHLCMS